MATTQKAGAAKKTANRSAKKTQTEKAQPKTENVKVTQEDIDANPDGELKLGETVGVPTDEELTQEEKEYVEAYNNYHKLFGVHPSPNLETAGILQAIKDHEESQASEGEASGEASEQTASQSKDLNEKKPEAKPLEGVLEPSEDQVVITDGTSPRLINKATWDLAKKSAGYRWKEVPSIPKELKTK